jgi:glycine/serine hydroxymethyltransferase
MKEPEMELVGGYIADVLDDIKDTDRQNEILKKVNELCAKFPVYPEGLV